MENLKNRIKNLFLIISLLGLGVLATACGKSAVTEDDVGADEAVVAVVTAPGQGQDAGGTPVLVATPAATPEATPPPAAVNPPPAPITCYHFAFVSDRGGFTDNVFLADSCNQQTPQRVTSNNDTHTHFGTLGFEKSGEQLSFDEVTVSLDPVFPNPVLADLTVSPIALTPIHNADLLPGNVFDGLNARGLAFEPNGDRVAMIITEGSVVLGSDEPAVDFDILALHDPAHSGIQYLVNDFAANEKISGIVWHPDGDKLIFSVKAGSAPGQLFVYNLSNDKKFPLNGSVIQLPNPGFEGALPAVAPDGSKLAFVRRVEQKNQVFTCDFTSRNLRPGITIKGCDNVQQLTTEGANTQPAWTPDSKAIFFASNRDSNRKIYRMNPDGSAQTRVLDGSGDDEKPSVSPVTFTIPGN